MWRDFLTNVLPTRMSKGVVSILWEVIFLFLRGGVVEEQLTAGIEYIHVLECLEPI